MGREGESLVVHRSVLYSVGANCENARAPEDLVLYLGALSNALALDLRGVAGV